MKNYEKHDCLLLELRLYSDTNFFKFVPKIYMTRFWGDKQSYIISLKL